MQIQIVSSLSREDESRLAQKLLTWTTSLLELLPIAYTVRIEAGDACVLQQSRIDPDNFVREPMLPKASKHGS